MGTLHLQATPERMRLRPDCVSIGRCRESTTVGVHAAVNLPAEPAIAITPGPDRGHVLECNLWLPRPIDEVFAFFGDARNLETITPPRLRFRILTPGPLDMRTGLLIDYRISLHGLPMRWRSEITDWNPPHRFVDTQARGPYRWWIHEHAFTERDGGTLVSDRVRFGVPGGRLITRLFINRNLEHIFAYRTRRLEQLLGPSSSS